MRNQDMNEIAQSEEHGPVEQLGRGPIGRGGGGCQASMQYISIAYYMKKKKRVGVGFGGFASDCV